MQHAMPKDFNVAGEAFERDTFERDTQAISDTSDAERIQTQACDAERRDAFERGELDIEDEFHMDSASIADAAHSASTEVQWTMLSGAPSFINGGCGQSTGTGGAPSFVNGGCGQSTVTASQLGLPEFTQRHGADSASKHPANTEERRAHALRQQCPHVMLLLIGRSAHRYRRFGK